MTAPSLVLPASPQAYRVRHRSRLCAAILFLVAVSAIPLRAQFQDPTPDELKMTADPKAPGAAAVYLYHEDNADGPGHASSIYDRIKVLTEKGKDLATVSIPYEPGVDKVTDIQARTIHADGTIIPLTAKPSDLVDIKTKGFQENTVTFTLPSVEVGSILEYRVKMRRDEDWTYLPTWEVQRTYFVHKEHYSFRPSAFTNMVYVVNIGPKDKVVQDKKDVFSLDIADVPPEPGDDWMPPMNTLRWYVEFFRNTGVTTADAFWENAGKRWAAWIESFTGPTGTLKKAVEQIVAPGETDEQKSAKIYAAVQKLDNTDFSRTKSKVERKKEKLKDIGKAEDVWKQQSGSADDIALLFAALARAAGLKAWPAYVVNRDRAMFNKGYLSDSQFDNDIVIVELGGKKVYLDPGQKMCPYGSLHWKHTWATGFELTDKGAILATTPGFTYKSSTVKRVADLDIDADGHVKGSLRLVMTGPNSLHWRQLALRNDEDEVSKQFNESMLALLPEGVQPSFDRFESLDDPSSSLVAVVNVNGNIGTATGKRLFLPGLFFQSRARHPFVAQDKRTVSVDVHYPLLEQDQVTYHLPSGFSAESTPQDANSSWPDHALLKIHSSTENGSVTVMRTLAYNFTLLAPEDYPNLHDFYQKVATADQQQLVLTRAPVVKGN